MTSTERSTTSFLTRWISVPVLYLLFIYFLKLPYLNLPILYYDDGETLYHVLALLEGKLPYKDTYTHHFTGYVFPIFFLGKMLGYSIDLIRHAFVINQALLAFGTYLCARLFFSGRIAFIGGLLALTAREPFVYSFFPLYQVSTCGIFVLWLSLRYLRKRSERSFPGAFFFAGLAFVIDQRGLLLLSLPLFSLLAASGESLTKRLLVLRRGIFAFLLTPLTALFFLEQHGILKPFIEQTIIYPQKFRVASISLVEQLQIAIKMHYYLLTETPLLLALAVIGLWGIFIVFKAEQDNRSCCKLLFFTAAPLFGIAFLGGRDFSYYTIPWLPYLALLALFSTRVFHKFILLKRLTTPLILSPVIIVACSIPAFINHLPTLKKRDEAIQIANLVRASIKPGESFFIFGYRPDIYASIPMLAASPFVNIIYIHPDSLIGNIADRLKHIDPDLQHEFFELLRSDPPDYLLFVDLNLGEADQSPASDMVRATIQNHYQLLSEFPGPLVKGKATSLRLYKESPLQASVPNME